MLIAVLLVLSNYYFLPMGLKIFMSAYLSRASALYSLVPIAQHYTEYMFTDRHEVLLNKILLLMISFLYIQ